MRVLTRQQQQPNFASFRLEINDALNELHIVYRVLQFVLDGSGTIFVYNTQLLRLYEENIQCSMYNVNSFIN